MSNKKAGKRARQESAKQRLESPNPNGMRGLRRKVKDGDLTPTQAMKIIWDRACINEDHNFHEYYANRKFIAWCRRRK